MRISGVTMLGPLEEKDAMNGAGFVPSFAFGAVINPTGLLLYHIYRTRESKHGV